MKLPGHIQELRDSGARQGRPPLDIGLGRRGSAGSKVGVPAKDEHREGKPQSRKAAFKESMAGGTTGSDRPGSCFLHAEPGGESGPQPFDPPDTLRARSVVDAAAGIPQPPLSLIGAEVTQGHPVVNRAEVEEPRRARGVTIEEKAELFTVFEE